MVMMAAMTIVSMAQMPNPTPIPLNPDVRHGQLENGLNYYILHNEEPKQRANFYIAQKVGSTLETTEQLGLAHFLEHMAFNGTKHYPGKNMLNYLQSKGIRFGEDINAYTGFDETVYNINNVPTTDKALMDSVLLVLSDWSGSILLEESEINAERGVIEEEWRSRDGAQVRMFTAILPQIFSEYQYQQMPIGKMEVVRNFAPQTLRDYYHKWYRPDQQGIVIVGDFDAAEMEQKVKDLFSKIPMPENAAPRVYPTVSDNEKPIFAQYADKEMPYSMIMVSFKSDKIPFEMRNTDLAYMQENVIEELISRMINNRLTEYSKKPECKYSYAGVSFGNFYVASTKAAFDITILAKSSVKEAYDDALAVVARACKTGFMPGEVTRARDEILAEYEKAYNERNNTKSDALARRLIRTFIDNTANPGAEKEYNMMKQILPMIPVEALNQLSATILTPNNQVIVVSQPERDNMEVVTADVMTTDLNKIINAEYEPYVDEVLPESLISKMPKAGKITSEKAGKFDTHEFTLSNGAKVIVKKTDFNADEIVFHAFAKGGRQTFSEKDAYNVNACETAVATSKLGNIKRSTLEKYLAGKKASVDFDFSSTLNNLKGKSTVKDLKTLMELVYEYFTDLQPDQEAYDSEISSVLSILREQEKNPDFVFQQKLSAARSNNSNLYNPMPSVAMFEQAKYPEMLKIAKAAMANAADYTFTFVGNIDIAVLKPMLEQYIASLPSTGKTSAPKVVTPIPVIKGDVKDMFDYPMQTPSTRVFVTIDNNDVPYSIENSVRVEAMGDILGNIFTDTLREEEGGTYSPFAFANLNPWTGYWQLSYLFQTNSDVQQKLIDRAVLETNKMLSEGVDETNFNKVKQAMVKQYENQVRTNSYWLDNLVDYQLGIDNITNHKSAIDSMTLSNFNEFMKKLNAKQNHLDFVMTGVPVK